MFYLNQFLKERLCFAYQLHLIHSFLEPHKCTSQADSLGFMFFLFAGGRYLGFFGGITVIECRFIDMKGVFITYSCIEAFIYFFSGEL